MNPGAHLTTDRKHHTGMLLALALCTVVAGGVRFAGLSTRDFWYDESCTYIYVANLFDWPEGSSLLTESTNLPYYVLLRGWSALFGDSEAGYRSLSALAATLTVPLVGLMAWHCAGRQAGMIAAALATLNPLHIYYAHEARAYALWMLTLTVLMWLLYEAARRGRARWWVAYGLVALFALPLHYYTFFWLPGSVLCLAVSDRPGRTFKQWLVSTLLIGICFTPYVLIAVLPAARGGGESLTGEGPANPMSWLALSWNPATALGESLWALLPAGAYPAHLHGLSLASRETVAVGSTGLVALARTVPAILLLVAALMVISGYCFRRGSHGLAAEGEGTVEAPASPGLGIHLFLAGLTLGPLLCSWCYSVAVKPTYLVGRYDVAAWPALAVWLGAIIVQAVQLRVPRHTVGVGAFMVAVILLACSLLPVARMQAQKKELSLPRGRANFLAKSCEPGDLVIAFSYDRDGLLYYLHRAGFAGEIVSFPSWLDGQVGWVDTATDLARIAIGELEPDLERLLTDCRHRLGEGHQVFRLSDYYDWDNAGPRNAVNHYLLDALVAHGYEAIAVFPNARIWRLERGTVPTDQGTSSGDEAMSPSTSSSRSSGLSGSLTR